MKLSEITAVLDQAGLPPLSREQLLELASTGAGKPFQAALVAFAGGDRTQRDRLEATVRALDPKVRRTLQSMGSAIALPRLVDTACREQRRFFDAIEAVQRRSDRAAAAQRYLVDLGFAAVPTAASAAPAAPPYYSFKIFGSGAALCIAEATTRADNKHTINIEGAVALGSAGGRQTYDWLNKIVVQLTVQEAYSTLALFENLISSVKFDGHGRTHDKSLHIELQGSHYFVRVIQRGRAAVALPVTAVDAIRIVALLYKQLLANDQHLRIEDIRALVARMASMTITHK